MKANFVEKQGNVIKFTIEFTAEEFDAATQAAYLKERSRITIDGFRKGKAPRSIIEKAYGTGVFFETAIDDLLKDAYPKALDELKIDPIDSPNLELGEEKIEKGKGFTATVSVEVTPEVELKEYKGIEFEYEDLTVTDEDVDKQVEQLRQKNARIFDSEEASALGDTVNIDYAGFVGDDQFAGGTSEGYDLKLGSNTFIPGFEDQLVGLKAGEEKDVVVTFPEDYSAENLAGKEATFKCKVNAVKKEELPTLDDEFVKDVSEFDTLDELKKDLRAKLENAAKEQNDYYGKNKAMLALCEANPVDIPEAMIKDEVDQMYNEYLQRLINQGISAEAVKKYLKASEANLKENFKADAKARVHTSLLAKAVVAKENIEATEEELEEEYKLYAAQYGMEVEEIKKAFASSVEYMKDDIKYRKAVAFVFDNAKKVAPKKD